MRFQSIYDIAELCVKKGLTDVVLCPGSRCAPLTLAFVRHPKMKPKTFSDERSAGFVALGIAQQVDQPVIIVCTSGTAVYNLAPAVAEAYFSQTPLIILTADRPSEWIAQHDGQTIYQTEIFGKHVKKYFVLPQEYEHDDDRWAINRIMNEAINFSQQEPRGPVHINAPFREPLYPAKDETFFYTKEVRVVEEYRSPYTLSDDQQNKIKKCLPDYDSILIVGGQQKPNGELTEVLSNFLTLRDTPLVNDIISNLNTLDKSVKHADLFLAQASDDLKQKLRPDLLITFGQSLISKNVKLFLRKFSPKAHWHIQPGGVVADTFKNVTDVFNTTPASFFNFLTLIFGVESIKDQKQSDYAKRWEAEEQRLLKSMDGFFQQQQISELEMVKEILENLPAECNLHLANSMSVRYANFIGLKVRQKGIRVFANRGTSGIDGCTSTSIGHYLASGKPTILITGDLAFFYDRNAFWHNYPIPDFRVLLLNNHGGLIFNVIDGPASLPEADEYFITRQSLNAKKLCEEFGFDYLKVDNKQKIEGTLKNFFNFDGKTKILELETEGETNKTLLSNLKQKIKKSYEL